MHVGLEISLKSVIFVSAIYLQVEIDMKNWAWQLVWATVFGSLRNFEPNATFPLCGISTFMWNFAESNTDGWLVILYVTWDDAISEALLVCLTIIEIIDAFVDFALFNTYCLNDGCKNL